MFFIPLFGTEKENLYENQEHHKFAIIFVILMTFKFDLRVVMYGEIRSQSLVVVEGLNESK